MCLSAKFTASHLSEFSEPHKNWESQFAALQSDLSYTLVNRFTSDPLHHQDIRQRPPCTACTVTNASTGCITEKSLAAGSSYYSASDVVNFLLGYSRGFVRNRGDLPMVKVPCPPPPPTP